MYTKEVDGSVRKTDDITYSYEDVRKKAVEYFNGDELAAEAWINKYALKDRQGNIKELTPDDMHDRIATELYRVESKYPNAMSYDLIRELIDRFKYIVPQGSPMAGIGNPYQITSLSNCFVIGNKEDSYGGIFKMDEEEAQLMKRRAGVGIDVSHLRPSGTNVNNSALTSTGVVPFMERFSNTTEEVAQDGRRGALMITINIDHPDAEEFIDAKMKQGKVTGANVSVKITDAFMKAAQNNEEYDIEFILNSGEKLTKTIDAAKLWNKIVSNAWESAEPGVMFWDHIKRESIPDCYADEGFETVSTNPSLKGDTLVLTDKGVYPIEFLANNKPDVKVMNYRGEFHNSKVFKSGENQQLVKITFSNGTSIKCTKEHKWPILNTSGNLVNPQTKEVIKKEAKDINEQDKIYHPSFDEPINNPDSNLTEEDGFILGWNQGDGWITYHKVNDSTQYGFIFSEEDVESGIGDKILNYTNDLSLRESKLRRDKNTKSFTYCTTDNSVVSKLESIGAWNKDFGVPKTVWSGNKEFIKGYIDGLFSSDGYVEYKDKLSKCRIVLVSSRTKLINDVQKLLSFYGVSSNIKHSISNGFERYDLTISGINAYKFSELFVLSNNNKNNKLNKIKQLNLNENSYSGRKEYANNRDYLVVSDVEFTDEYEDVYDITVYDDTHTFITECGVTGNCGEIPLSIGDSCRLIAMNLYSFVEEPFTENAYFNWDKFREYTNYAARIMDDIIDIELERIDNIINKIENDPEPEHIKWGEKELWSKIRSACEKGRRAGIGVTGEGDMLAALGYQYGTSEASDLSEEVHKIYAVEVFRESANLAKERGSFPVYDEAKEKGNPFVERIFAADKEVERLVKENGRRFIGNLTIAPTGTVSLMTQTTSGIECAFMVSFQRKRKINPNDQNARSDYIDQKGVHWQKYHVFHQKFEDWMKANGYDISGIKEMDGSYIDEIVQKSPYYNATSNDVDWVEKVRMQGKIQKWVDHSISVTTNLPKDITKETVNEVYKTAWEAGCKGCTIYRDGSREGVLVKNNEEEAKFDVNHAPKRPKALVADITRFQNNHEKWIGFIGLYEGRPFEIFTGKLDSFPIPNYVERGQIIKSKLEDGSSKYDFVYYDKNGEYNVAEWINTAFDSLYWDYAKIISGVLRHGMPLEYVIDLVRSLNLGGDAINTWKNGVERMIKRFVSDGTVVPKVKCMNCESDNLAYQEGCLVCNDCGSGHCG